ncbi:MAG: hypothetical protein ACRDRW_07405 [Pseudonocardiaceae bacterium]
MKPNESPADSAPPGAPPGARQEAPQLASPFPPAFRWDTSPAEASTRVLSARGRDSAQGDPAEVTQVMRAIPAYQQGSDQARDLFQPFEPPLNEPIREASAPPWTEEGLPPIAEQQSAWLRQGAEAFTTPVVRSRSKQLMGIAVLAVVVLGLVGATVAYFLTNGPSRVSGDPIAAPQPTTAPRDLPAPPAQLAPPVDTAHALSDPPGQPRGGDGLFDLPQLMSPGRAGLLPGLTVYALQAGRMTDGMVKTTTVGANTIAMFALTMPDEKAATTVADTIADVQRRGGLKADDHRALQGVTVMGTAPGSDSVAYRAVYVLYNRAIFVEVFGPNRDAVLATFDSLLTQQVTYAPPTVRVGR